MERTAHVCGSSSIIDAAIEDSIQDLGLDTIKPKQRDAIQSFLSGNDTLVVLPTGYGKSLIYAVLPLIFDKLRGCQKESIVLVVSPLTALMMDQKRILSQKGLSVEYVGEKLENIDDVLKGKVQLVYISPESLLGNAKIRKMLLTSVYSQNLVGFVVDEAHCVKIWGDKFRRTFAEIGTIRSLINKEVNILALTATATHETVKSIFERLSMTNVTMVGLPPERPNIKYFVVPMPKMADLCSILAQELISMKADMPKTVLFCQSLPQCGDFHVRIKRLLKQNIAIPPTAPSLFPFRMLSLFTSAFRTVIREKTLQEFCKEKTNLRLIIATTAFSLGVDCRDITRIINWGASNSLEELVQESGRAGRDSSEAKSILYYGKGAMTHISKPVKIYGENQSHCRRTLLFKDFLFSDVDKHDIVACRCCDLCARLCVCAKCKNNN
ncbi:uncharacterized protein [Dysidea avara]|uniref:uncharacterized protein n=1 Tax=Dysidea avara TaxID=196820 RepID=UPI003328B6E3